MMDSYLKVVRRKLKDFKSVQVMQIPWPQNNHTDTLACLATSKGIEEFNSFSVGRIS